MLRRNAALSAGNSVQATYTEAKAALPPLHVLQQAEGRMHPTMPNSASKVHKLF